MQQRDTRQRRLVLDTLRSMGNHPSADQIYLSVREHDPKISRGTVYRNLNLLSDNGEVLHIRVPGADRFDHRTDPHYHVICMTCGLVCDADIPYCEQYDPQTEAATGFTIRQHRTVFEGTCPECQAQAR